MVRLIDADKLWMVIEGEHEYYERFEIDDAPTVDAEPVRHGKWIHKWSGDGSVWLEQSCSECGLTYDDEPFDYNYCPYCGAKMDGEDGEE